MIEVQWLGRVPYAEALRWQRLRREGIERGNAPEVLWMLEHPPVITLGRRGGLPDGVEQVGGVPVCRVERGGLATYHGPGQLVGYLLVDLGRHRWSVPGAVRGIEQGVITWLQRRCVEAAVRADAPGVWVGEEKICALGLHIRRKHTMHGFALNLGTALSAFGGFVPCGLSGLGVTSLERLTGAAPKPEEVALEVGNCVVEGIVAAHA